MALLIIGFALTLLFCFLFGFVCSLVADAKNIGAASFFFAGFFFGPIALLIVLCIPKRLPLESNLPETRWDAAQKGEMLRWIGERNQNADRSLMPKATSNVVRTPWSFRPQSTDPGRSLDGHLWWCRSLHPNEAYPLGCNCRNAILLR